MRRTRALVAAASAAALLTLAGCSSDAETESEATETASDDAAFPAVVETTFGEVTVEEEPERVVALGWGDAETALALGVQPVGATDWLGFGGDGVGPWADGMYDESPELIDALQPSYEAIAALEPDLILDVRGSGEQERYDRLSSIAPTIGVPEGGENYLTTSDDQMTMIATALGMTEKGDELLAEVDTAFTDAAEAHPDWAGQTVTAATRTGDGWGAYVESEARTQFLLNLGFEQNPEIDALTEADSNFFVSISEEQLDLIDADLVVAFPIGVETADITDDSQWQALPAVADGRSLVIDGDLSNAYSLGTTMATLYAIDQMVPLIEDTLG
ncbi:iron-siderophore ABC transporter substrate-binding protein [Paraoerskovia marina]|uniref:iron-siderophore ABC transporter substrate-binding protein n=1 Tax=Paraoerskovia marina TaxID=545619 RepID=UPI000492B9D6|nr:iron-siderophore ABC transporter substrate-binding protein [Paraoerskovia marina]